LYNEIMVHKPMFVRFEAFTAVTMKNVFWDVALCRSCVNRRFGEDDILQICVCSVFKNWLSMSFIYRIYLLT
jgi:hypothetical protein